MGKIKKVKDKMSQNTISLKGDQWRPICITENKPLASCMQKEEAMKIIREHEKKHFDHVVDIEKC